MSMMSVVLLTAGTICDKKTIISDYCFFARDDAHVTICVC